MQINREALAWAGGFFSGEGSTHVHTNSYVRKDGRRRKYVRMSITNTNLKALQRFHLAVGGIGMIYQAPCHTVFRKPQWQWSAKNFEATTASIGLLWAFLTEEKQEQIKRVIKDCNGF